MSFQELASYKRFETHLTTTWPEFQAKRSKRLRQRGRFGEAKEPVAENIVQDLFTVALGQDIGHSSDSVRYYVYVMLFLNCQERCVLG
jgi:hypothetical protein